MLLLRIVQGKSQVDFALGSSGRSYVVGFGNKSPESPFQKVHHYSASLSACCAVTFALLGFSACSALMCACLVQTAWNSWLNYNPGKATDDQLRNDFLSSPQPNR
jgi:hypothetical protein